MPETNKVIIPDYYGGKDNPYECRKVIRAWDLPFSLGSVLKYISRHGKKNKEAALTDLLKAQNYLNDEIEYLKGKEE